ncbi:hypothetical protein [Methanobrevibacter smithii]|uniref:hypothetical protein n=1 Tax=Methanobrevibacter smithii TaxID=2173 RepID=UPI0037DC5E96
MLESVDNIPKKNKFKQRFAFYEENSIEEFKDLSEGAKKIAEDIYNFIKSCN